jgi:RimJ/RimL family protein N-acetyltransferase
VTGGRFPERIETARLTLRPPTEADVPGIVAAVSASYAEPNEWMPWARGPYGADSAQAFCEASLEALAAEREYCTLLLHRDDDRIIGSMGLLNARWEVPRFEIGYWVHTGYVGQGYCSEGVRGLTRMAFEQLGANRVEVTMDDRNRRSWAVAERLGFELEALLRHDRRDNHGRLADTRVYAMLDIGQLR